MKFSLQDILKHLAVILVFVVASLAYFYPVLQGKAIFQSDIAQYKGMAKERDDYKKTTGIESYWTNSAFAGMPTYQLGANYPHDYIKKTDRLIRFLPRPADYLFLYFLGFYLLMLCLKVDWRLAILGSLAFGFSTYMIIILGVGHNAKAHALGYIPMVLGGIVLTFRKKYLLGFLLTAIAMALEISANHYQMTYYFMLLVLIMGLVYLVYAVKEKQLKHFFVSVAILVGAVVLAIATNATGLLATKQYADWSTRGKSELTLNPDGTKKEVNNGLDKEYITDYSFGISESLVLLVPRMFGGSNNEDLGRDSKSYDFLTKQGLPPSRALEFTSGLPLYWGEQPIVAGPAYIGAMIVFLFILALFLVKSKHKWWLVFGALLSLMLSWGKNFPVLTNVMIDYFPLYNKFRAVSSAQVVLELCFPALAILGLRQWVKKSVSKQDKLNALKWSSVLMGGLVIFLFLIKSSFDFEGRNDAYYAQNLGELMNMILLDREMVYTQDLIRSLIYVLLAAGALWLYTKGRFKENVLYLGLGALLLFDLVGVAQRYVNEDDFIRNRLVERPYQVTQLDQQIQQDTDVFRVFDSSEGLNGARTSYFHKSLGGYHAAKPARLQDLFEYHLYQNNLEVLNMLNVKYIIQQDETGQKFPGLNDEANGIAWFVENVKAVSTSDEEIKALEGFDSKKEAVLNTRLFSDVTPLEYTVDSLATLELVDHRPDFIQYRTENPHEGFVVFSEMHYPEGWKSFIDGKETPHVRVNYALRGMKVPKGTHQIEFAFEPEVIQTGSKIALGANVLLALAIGGGLLYFFRKPKKTKG